MEEEKRVEEVREKTEVEETNAAVQISEETKKTEDKDKGKESEPVEAMPPSPVQQMTLPYMKRKEETEVENPIVEVEEAFSYFSTSSSTTLTGINFDGTDSESTLETSTNTLMDSNTNDVNEVASKEATTFDEVASFDETNTFEEPRAASVVLEAQAIVAAVIGKASFISSFGSTARSKSVEEEEGEDPLAEERKFSAVKREMSDSDSEVNDQSKGSGLLEEIKEEIMTENKTDIVSSLQSKPSESFSKKKSNYKQAGTWTNITITSNIVHNTEEPLSPAEDKVKMLELRMMMEEMERMVEFLEEEMKDLQMRVQMDQMTLVTLASLVTPPLAGVEPGGKDCEEEGEGLESAKSCF